MSGPLGRTGGTLLEFLGITKSNANFLQDMSNQVVPVIAVSNYLWPEFYRVHVQDIPAITSGFNVAFANSSNRTILLYGATCYTNLLGAGVQAEIRPMLQSDDSISPFQVPIGVVDVASGVNESVISGGLFLEAPIPIPPGWRVGAYVSTLVGAGPLCAVRLLISS